MLIAFYLRNWRNFAEETGFSMLPSREIHFNYTLPRFATCPKRLLPIAAIHGANGYGKSNLLKALFFLTQFIINGCDEDGEMPAEPYQLSKEKQDEPTSFSILFRTRKNIYYLELLLTKMEIISEKLTLVLLKEERILYDRNIEEINIHSSVDSEKLQSVFKNIQKNTAFLTAAYKEDINFVKDAYEWFKNSLKFIDTNTNAEHINTLLNDSEYQKKLYYYLYIFDIEINRIFLNLQDKNTLKNNIDASKLNFMHMNIEKNSACFDFEHESDGIKRLIDLLQILVEPCENSNIYFVYIVDDIDRHLHTNLLHQFITNFLLQSSAKSRVQLIATTNNSVLMDTQLLRRDEIWLIDKQLTGSSICSVSDFKIPKSVRYMNFDTKLEKLYREGRLGGVPRIVYQYLFLYR